MPTVIPASITCFGDFGMPSRVLADFEEGRFQTFVGISALSSTAGVLGQGPSSKVKTTSLVVEEAVLLEMLEAEAGAAGGVDLDDPREAHAAGLVALRDGAGGWRAHVLSGSVGRRVSVPAGAAAWLSCSTRAGAPEAPGVSAAPTWANWLLGGAARALQRVEILARPAERRSPEPEQLSFSQLRGRQRPLRR